MATKHTQTVPGPAMPPRWGLGSVGDLTCYKHAAPLALPESTIQREFGRRVAAVEKLKTAHRAHLAELDVLFASLQQRLQRGTVAPEERHVYSKPKPTNSPSSVGAA